MSLEHSNFNLDELNWGHSFHEYVDLLNVSLFCSYFIAEILMAPYCSHKHLVIFQIRFVYSLIQLWCQYNGRCLPDPPLFLFLFYLFYLTLNHFSCLFDKIKNVSHNKRWKFWVCLINVSTTENSTKETWVFDK